MFTSLTQLRTDIFACSRVNLPLKYLFFVESADHFEYLRNGNCITIDGVDDRKEFQETVHALTLLGGSVSLLYRTII